MHIRNNVSSAATGYVRLELSLAPRKTCNGWGREVDTRFRGRCEYPRHRCGEAQLTPAVHADVSRNSSTPASTYHARCTVSVEDVPCPPYTPKFVYLFIFINVFNVYKLSYFVTQLPGDDK